MFVDSDANMTYTHTLNLYPNIAFVYLNYYIIDYDV